LCNNPHSQPWTLPKHKTSIWHVQGVSQIKQWELFCWTSYCLTVDISILMWLIQIAASFVSRAIGPMHEEKILGNTHNNTHCLVLVSFLKVGIPLLKINTLQRFKYWPSLEGFTLLVMKTKTRQWVPLGAPPKILYSCIGPMQWCQTEPVTAYIHSEAVGCPDVLSLLYSWDTLYNTFIFTILID